MKFRFKKTTHKIIDPKRDWYIMIIIFLLLSLLSAIFGAYIYFVSVNYVADISSTNLGTPDNASVSKLHQVVSNLDKMKADFEKAKITTYDVSDPSL